jgi:hypothetical protein
MNELLKMLSGGDIRSDGEADQVADIVLENPHMLDELMVGLDVEDDVIRGRTAHALERVARTHPEWMLPYLPRLLDCSESDPLPMVRWHLVMVLGDLAIFKDQVDVLNIRLIELLDDPSVFVKSWVISSLCIIAKLYPERNESISRRISEYRDDDSIAIRARVRKAMEALMDPTQPLPKGWVKSDRI